MSFIKSKDPNLVNCISSNFGFGIGSGYKEDMLAINANNRNKIEAGMVFHLRVTFKECQNGALKNTSAAIGDTVLIRIIDGALETLTSRIPCKFGDITYTLDGDGDNEDSEEEEDDGRERKEKVRKSEYDSSDVRHASTDVIMPTRTRHGKRD